MSRALSSFGHGGVTLLILVGCSRTFVTNNYLTPTEKDAAIVETEAAAPNLTETGPEDAAVDTTSDVTVVVVDAGESMATSSNVLDASRSIDAAADEGDAADGAVVPVEPLAPGAPVVNTGLEAQTVDLFGTFNNHFWFIATQDQVNAINLEFQGGGGGWWGGYGGGDIYQPNSGQEAINAVEHLVITTPDNKTADYGQVNVKLVGQSTGRTWSESTLPNFKIDSDDVTSGLRIGGYEHFRLNNGVIGTIFREKFVYDFYNALGYPAPRSSYAWVSTTVWEPDVKVPYIMTESYKRGFCKTRPEYFGGECPNMWEFASDFGYGGVFDYEENCQFEECDATRANQFEAAVMDARNGGVTTLEDVGEYLDWEKFHEFHCLAWMFGTTDSPPLTSNNTLWAERPDGKFQMFPYSIDISLSLWGGYGDGWYDPGLYGGTVLADLCNQDEECWGNTIATCEEMITKFTALDPVARLDKLHTELKDAGMLRSGDEGRYNDLRVVLGDMVAGLPAALDNYRAVRQSNSYCHYYGMVDCGGYCSYVEDCYLCDDEYYENPDNYPPPNGTGGPVITVAPPIGSGVVTMGATTATGTAPAPTTGTAPAPTGDVMPPSTAGDAGVEPLPDGGYVPPVKPDFCYYYDYMVGQKEQEVYVLDRDAL